MDRKRQSSKAGIPDHSTERDRGDYKPNKTRRRIRKPKDVDYANNPTYRVEADAVDKEVLDATDNGREIDKAKAFPEPPPPIDDASQAIGKHITTMGSYSREYKLKLVHRMLIRNMPLSTIADSLKVSVGQVRDLRTELYQRLAVEAQNFDMATHVGESTAFFQEVRGVAMRIATDNKQSGGARVGALNVALEAQKDTIRFMQAIGTYENNPMQWGHKDDAAMQRGELLQEMAEMFLMGDDVDDGMPALLDEDGRVINEEEENVSLIGGYSK